MKNSIKTVTLTIDELNKIVADSASGNVDAAKSLIATKIHEKSERLQKQRELRRQRKAQKKIAQPKPDSTPEAQQKTITLPLSRDLAKCILWIHNRRDALKSNISLLLKEMVRSGYSKSAIAEITTSIQLLLLWAKDAAPAAHNHLHAKYSLRPTSAHIECKKLTTNTL